MNLEEIIILLSLCVILYVLRKVNRGEAKNFHINIFLGFISIFAILICLSFMFRN